MGKIIKNHELPDLETRFRFFQEKFPLFSGIIPEKGRKNAGNKPGKKRNISGKKQTFKVAKFERQWDNPSTCFRAMSHPVKLLRKISGTTSEIYKYIRMKLLRYNSL